MTDNTKIVENNLTTGFLLSHDLTQQHLRVKLLGCVVVRKLALENLHSLRLAAREEVSWLYFILNWTHFLPAKRARCPVYVVSHKKQRIALKLQGASHYSLRKAIADRTRANVSARLTGTPQAV